jgi:hypothetical protein
MLSQMRPRVGIAAGVKSRYVVVVDGVHTLRLLIAAAKHLAARSPSTSSLSDDTVFLESSRLVAEAGVALAKLRRLGELQEMLVEVTALVAAGVDGAEVDAKLARATWMADELAVELATAASTPEKTRGLPAGLEGDSPVTARQAESLD